MTEAKRWVAKLADYTCQLVREGTKRLERNEQLKNLRRKLQGVLKFTASTLASAMLTMAVQSPEALKGNMTEAGRAAICILARRTSHYRRALAVRQLRHLMVLANTCPKR